MATIRLPIIGKYESVVKAIQQGKIDLGTYVYITDKNNMAYVGKDGRINLYEGNNVQRLDALPSVSDANINYLYIVDNVVYTFTGTEFKAQYVDLTSVESRLTKIEDQLKDLVNPETGETVNVVTYVQDSVAPVQTQVDTLEEKVGSVTMIISGGASQ